MGFTGKSETSQQVCTIGGKNSLMKQNYRTKEEVYLSLWWSDKFPRRNVCAKTWKTQESTRQSRAAEGSLGFPRPKREPKQKLRGTGKALSFWKAGTSSRRVFGKKGKLAKPEHEGNEPTCRGQTAPEKSTHAAVVKRDEDACTETGQRTGERPGPWHTRDTGSRRLEEQLGLEQEEEPGRNQSGGQLSFMVRAGVLHSHCNPLPVNFWRGRLVLSLTEEGRGGGRQGEDGEIRWKTLQVRVIQNTYVNLISRQIYTFEAGICLHLLIWGF